MDMKAQLPLVAIFKENMSMSGILLPIRENWTKRPFTETYLENQTIQAGFVMLPVR